MDPLASSDINGGWAPDPAPAPVQVAPQSPTAATSASSTYIRDPKVYGDPGTSLVSPPPSASGSSKTNEPAAPFLRVRIGALERNRKDLLIRYDASTNLPNFRTSLYRNMQRSYVEFQRFAEQVQLCCPQTIIPALPLPHTNAATDEEDDRLVRIALQRWFSRVCDDPVLQQEDELRSFIESDFGYQPVPPPHVKRQSTSTSAAAALTSAISKVVRRGPLDEDDEIQSAKMALEKLEPGWAAAAGTVGAVGKARKAHATASAEVGAKLIALATDEADMGLATAERKIGRTYEQLSSMAGAQIASDNVILNDSLAYQALNARAGRDALAQRAIVLEDSQNAAKSAISKRRNVERLKNSSRIDPMKVDDAIAEMQEADALETQLTSRVRAISTNLHIALRTHSRNTHEDVAICLLEHARMSIIFNRQTLRELEALKPDLTRIGTVAAASTPTPVQSSKTTTSTPLPASSAGGTAPPAAGSRAPPPTVPSGPSGASQSMFLPPPSASGNAISRPQSTDQRGGAAPGGGVDPLTGAPVAPMAQSMMLPGRAGTPGRAPPRRLDERKAAKLLAGGF